MLTRLEQLWRDLLNETFTHVVRSQIVSHCGIISDHVDEVHRGLRRGCTECATMKPAERHEILVSSTGLGIMMIIGGIVLLFMISVNFVIP